MCGDILNPELLYPVVWPSLPLPSSDPWDDRKEQSGLDEGDGVYNGHRASISRQDSAGKATTIRKDALHTLHTAINGVL